mgnify:CR=1 FL=1
MRIALPIPPSVNAMFVNSPNRTGKGRFPSTEYKAWKGAVYKRLTELWNTARPLDKPYAVCIRININRQSDIDNRVKAILDALVATGVLVGDQWVDDCRIIRDVSVEACEVEIWSLKDGDE